MRESKSGTVHGQFRMGQGKGVRAGQVKVGLSKSEGE